MVQIQTEWWRWFEKRLSFYHLLLSYPFRVSSPFLLRLDSVKLWNILLMSPPCWVGSSDANEASSYIYVPPAFYSSLTFILLWHFLPSTLSTLQRQRKNRTSSIFLIFLCLCISSTVNDGQPRNTLWIRFVPLDVWST